MQQQLFGFKKQTEKMEEETSSKPSSLLPWVEK